MFKFLWLYIYHGSHRPWRYFSTKLFPTNISQIMVLTASIFCGMILTIRLTHCWNCVCSSLEHLTVLGSPPPTCLISACNCMYLYLLYNNNGEMSVEKKEYYHTVPNLAITFQVQLPLCWTDKQGMAYCYPAGPYPACWRWTVSKW